MSTSNLGDDLGPFQPLRAQEPRFQAYVRPVEDDPASAAEKLRRLHRKTSLGQENNELYAWADKMGNVLPHTEMYSGDFWRKLVEADIMNILLDIIMRDDFWPSHWYFCYPIISSATGVVRYARMYKDSVATDALLARVSALWGSIWEKRSHLRSLRTCLDRRDGFPEPIVELLFEYTALYRLQHQGGPLFDTYIPHVAMHAWIIYGGDSPVEDILPSLSFIETVGSEGCGQFFCEMLGLSDPGRAEYAVKFIKREISKTSVAATLKPFLAPLLLLSNLPELTPLYGTYTLLSEASSMVDRIYDGPGTRAIKLECYIMPMTFLAQVLPLYTDIALCILKGHADGPLGFEAKELMNIFATGVDLLVGNGGAKLSGVDHLLCKRVSTFVDIWSEFYAEERKEEDGMTPLSRTFCDEMRSCARAVWWPNMDRLHTALHRTGSIATPEEQKLAEDWAVFGERLGLDATRERMRHEKAVLNRCAWRGCQYHRKKPNDLALSACKGCGEMRYCGRECQKNDWSKGGHKMWCGNRLK